MGIKVTCPICAHQTCRATDLADHMRRKHPGAPLRVPVPSRSSCTDTPPIKRRKMEDPEFLPGYRIPKIRQRKSPRLQPTVCLEDIKSTPPRTQSKAPASPAASSTPRADSTPPAQLIHPAQCPPPPAPPPPKELKVDLESPPLATRTVIKLNLSTDNSLAPSPESPSGVRSGFKKNYTHEMGSKSSKSSSQETDSENTRATKNLMQLLQDYGSEIPSIPGTPVQDEHFVPLYQDNIVSVERHEVKQETAEAPPSPEQPQPQVPPAPTPGQEPEEESTPPPAQADTPQTPDSDEEISAEFTGTVTMSEKGFKINVSGDKCLIM